MVEMDDLPLSENDIDALVEYLTTF